MTQVGKVYLVGAGPGDPGLLTLKGMQCLQQADLVLYDGLVNPLLLRHTNATAERTCRVGGPGKKTLDQSEINQQLVHAAQQGKNVVRLKGGDPFIFGRGSEEAAALAEAGIPFEVVPGITAATAVAEYAGISLTHREMASAVAFVTGHENPNKPESSLDYAALAAFPGTLVFYMGSHRLPEISKTLTQEGKPSETPVAVVSHGSTPKQKVVSGTLENIAERAQQAKIRPPSLIIVGECALQREKINWFESLPLLGVSIGLTRPEHQADSAIDAAWEFGAEPVLMPMIEIQPLQDFTKLDEALDELASYDWLIFTSVNSVEAVLERLWSRGQDARAFGNAKIAAIGPATLERLEEYHLRADLVPEVYRGEALAEALAHEVVGKRVLWPRASRGRDVIPERLTAAGAQIDQVMAYQHQDVDSLPADVIEKLEQGTLDWIALSSPSIAVNVARLVPESLRHARLKFVAISPVTEEAAITAGLKVAAVATDHTWPGIFDAILNWYEMNRSIAR